MKKILATILSLIMGISIIACGQTTTDPVPEPEPSTIETSPVNEIPTPDPEPPITETPDPDPHPDSEPESNPDILDPALWDQNAEEKINALIDAHIAILEYDELFYTLINNNIGLGGHFMSRGYYEHIFEDFNSAVAIDDFDDMGLWAPYILYFIDAVNEGIIEFPDPKIYITPSLYEPLILKAREEVFGDYNRPKGNPRNSDGIVPNDYRIRFFIKAQDMYMMGSVIWVHTLFEYNSLNTLKIGESFPIDSFIMSNGYQSAYAVPIYLDGHDYNIYVIFGECGKMLNIIMMDLTDICNYLIPVI